jgi:hypothetical protein
VGRTHTLLEEDVNDEAERSERSLQGHESVVGIAVEELSVNILLVFGGPVPDYFICEQSSDEFFNSRLSDSSAGTNIHVAICKFGTNGLFILFLLLFRNRIDVTFLFSLLIILHCDCII